MRRECRMCSCYFGFFSYYLKLNSKLQTSLETKCFQSESWNSEGEDAFKTGSRQGAGPSGRGWGRANLPLGVYVWEIEKVEGFHRGNVHSINTPRGQRADSVPPEGGQVWVSCITQNGNFRGIFAWWLWSHPRPLQTATNRHKPPRCPGWPNVGQLCNSRL